MPPSLLYEPPGFTAGFTSNEADWEAGEWEHGRSLTSPCDNECGTATCAFFNSSLPRHRELWGFRAALLAVRERVTSHRYSKVFIHTHEQLESRRTHAMHCSHHYSYSYTYRLTVTHSSCRQCSLYTHSSLPCAALLLALLSSFTHPCKRGVGPLTWLLPHPLPAPSCARPR